MSGLFAIPPSLVCLTASKLPDAPDATSSRTSQVPMGYPFGARPVQAAPFTGRPRPRQKRAR